MENISDHKSTSSFSFKGLLVMIWAIKNFPINIDFWYEICAIILNAYFQRNERYKFFLKNIDFWLEISIYSQLYKENIKNFQKKCFFKNYHKFL